MAIIGKVKLKLAHHQTFKQYNEYPFYTKTNLLSGSVLPQTITNFKNAMTSIATTLTQDSYVGTDVEYSVSLEELQP